jgi:exonuclease VII large subunit
MLESNPDWLLEHMRGHIANTGVANSSDNVFDFPLPSNATKNPGAAALDLVYQAAELIEQVDNYAAEKHARAEMLAKQAIEKLNIAHERVRSADSARLAAESSVKEFSEQVERRLAVKIQEIERVMEQTASRMAANEAQLTAAEQRAKAAETRAAEAEDALRRIEQTLRTQILEKRRSGPGKIAKAA